MTTTPDAVHALATLAEPSRRRMYDYISGRREPVSREEAAAVAGIPRGLAAFHLDKLVDAGLLKTRYARTSGRTGPGAGRTAKLYEPTEQDISVSIPARGYDLAGRILSEAVAAPLPHESSGQAALRVAYDVGERIGESSTARRKPGSSETALKRAAEVVDEHGYEPYPAGPGSIRLRNCPFHALAKEHPELICGTNRALLAGVLAGLGSSDLDAVLDPVPGECCVRIVRRDEA